VPIPPLGYSSTSRDNLPEQVPAFLVKGKTTREEVLLALGAPDSHSPTGEWFAYRSERHTGGVVFVIAGGYHAGAAGIVGYEERLLMVRFDERGVVVEVTFDHAICPRGVVVLDTGAAAQSPRCVKLPDPDGPSPELSALTSVFVVKADRDTRDTDRLVVAELRRLGLDATAGPASAAPPNAEAIVTYHDTWTTDASPRLDLLGLLVTSGSSQVLSKGSARQAPPAVKTPEQMVAAAVTDAFRGRSRPFLTMPPYRPASQRQAAVPPAGATVAIEPVRDARSAPRGRLIGERTALGMRLGMIDMAPAPVEIVGQVLREELALLGHASVTQGGDHIVAARILTFEVRTPSTLVYWDVNGSIEIEVGVAGGKDGAPEVFRYRSSCTDRTYVALSESLIQSVVANCLEQLGTKVREDAALARRLAGKPDPG
jgi:hypothetical protein